MQVVFQFSKYPKIPLAKIFKFKIWLDSNPVAYLTKAELLLSSESVTGREKLLKLFIDQYFLDKVLCFVEE